MSSEKVDLNKNCLYKAFIRVDMKNKFLLKFMWKLKLKNFVGLELNKFLMKDFDKKNLHCK